MNSIGKFTRIVLWERSNTIEFESSKTGAVFRVIKDGNIYRIEKESPPRTVPGRVIRFIDKYDSSSAAAREAERMAKVDFL